MPATSSSLIRVWPSLLGIYVLVVAVLTYGAEGPRPIMSDSSGLHSPAWRQLPSYPRERAVAGVLAGRHGNVLIAAGGANFPDRPPWEGGTKKTYSDIHVYSPAEPRWEPAGDLPEPRGYAAVVSLSTGVLVIGGENAE